MMTGVELIGEEASYLLQRLAREQMKERLMQDILFDLKVCEIDGFCEKEYIEDLISMLEGLKKW